MLGGEALGVARAGMTSGSGENEASTEYGMKERPFGEFGVLRVQSGASERKWGQS